jgi:ComF family protein
LWKKQLIPAKIFLMGLKKFLSDLLFPRFCLNCRKEGENLCQDCLSLIDLNQNSFCPFCRPPKIVFDARTCPSCRKNRKLTGLFSATSYHNFTIKKLISQFKYQPFVRELGKTLASLIIQHFQMLEYKPPFFRDKSLFVLTPVPLHKKRLKWRGFNHAQEIARHVSDFYKIPLVNDVLLKIKETKAQIELPAKEREANVRGVFSCPNSMTIKNKKILLLDDFFTTGSTMEECARVLKEAGAREVWGVVVARE